MSHSDPEFLALAALGEHAGTADDAAHLAQCPDCQLELERLTRLADLARAGGPVVLEQPPASVWERIAAATGPAETAWPGAAPGLTTHGLTTPGLATPDPEAPDPEVPPAGVRGAANGSRPHFEGAVNGRERVLADKERVPADQRPAPARRPARRRRLGRAAAGLAAGLVIGIGGTAAVEQLTRPAATQVVAQVELRPFPQFPHSAGTAVLRDTQSAQQLTVTVTAPAPSGFYEAWLLGADGTSMISLGDLNADHASTFTLPARVNLHFYSRVDISLQPFNGSTQHSGTSVVRGSLPATVTASAGG